MSKRGMVECLLPIGSEEEKIDGRVMGRVIVSHSVLCARYEGAKSGPEVSLVPVIKEGCCYSCRFKGG